MQSETQAGEGMAEMAEVSRIVSEWKHGPMLSPDAIQTILSVLAPSPPAGGGEPVAWRDPAGDAEAFIAKLVNMQSGQGWSRSVVREAAANFLAERGIKPPHGPDSTPEIVARTSPDAAQQRIRELEEALARAQAWHESEDKALSKSGRSDADYHWRRLQHREQLDGIRASLPEADYSAAWDRINARTAGGSADE
jgi:hypothetical protein